MTEKNMVRCRNFYETYGSSMIHEKFSEYEKRIAVGFVGEGSDCFGFDDDISTDHDYGTGFCMWLTDEDFDKIGAALQKEYQKLIESYGNDDSLHLFLAGRRGVSTITNFYASILGTDITKQKMTDYLWMTLPEDRIATAVNGEVYRDDLGEFTKSREMLLQYYPERVWLLKLAEQMYHFSQNIQSNYARMMARKDYLTAEICVMQAAKSAMSLVYLLNRRFAPYYKWMRKGMEELRILPEVGSILDEIVELGSQRDAWVEYTYDAGKINEKDAVIMVFERIASIIVKELNTQNIIQGNNPFLDVYSKEIIRKLQQ